MSIVIVTGDIEEHHDAIAVCDLWYRGLMRAVQDHVWNMSSQLLQCH